MRRNVKLFGAAGATAAALVIACSSIGAQAGSPQAAVDAAYAKFKDLKEGKNADYIPALAKVDPALFGIALVTVDGKGRVLVASGSFVAGAGTADAARLTAGEAVALVTDDVAPYDEMVRLTVIHDELEVGSAMAKGIQQGWPIVLSSLKSLLETGQGIDVFAKAKAA